MHTWGRTMDVVLDHLGWRPLSTELDYPASMVRMWRKIFPDVLAKFGIDLESDLH